MDGLVVHKVLAHECVCQLSSASPDIHEEVLADLVARNDDGQEACCRRGGLRQPRGDNPADENAEDSDTVTHAASGGK